MKLLRAMAGVAVLLALVQANRKAVAADSDELWNLARQASASHRFSTLFTAQDVSRSLASEEGLKQALDWCRRTAVTKVYVESFRDGYQAERSALERVRDTFRAAGFEVSGCVTPTSVGKRSSRWNIIACYTDGPTQERIGRIFEFTAGLFDEIMIDDFWFTDCSCAECDAARKARQVSVAGQVTTAAGETWDDYRRELMLRLSADRVLGPAKRVNPKCRLIVKYPQWYDAFHERGYDVDRETRLFDRIWVGTETRDYEDKQWGGTVQYEAFFIMRWLGEIGGTKCGGGWYDWLGTTERTYVEQARETVLGGARESMLFCYGGLQGSTGPKNTEALRREIPELLRVAREAGQRTLKGIAAYKPVNSAAGGEKRVFDFVGMLGLPLVPCHEFPTNAPAACFAKYALADPEFAGKLRAYVAAGHPVLLTDGLAAELPEDLRGGRPGIPVLPVKGDPKRLLELPSAEVEALRAPLLKPLGTTFRAPVRVAFSLFADGSTAVRNFNDTEAVVEVDGQTETIPARGWRSTWKTTR